LSAFQRNFRYRGQTVMGLLEARFEPAWTFRHAHATPRADTPTRSIADARPMSGTPLTVRHLASVADVARADWDRLFAGHAEGWDYFQACERATPEDFAASALGAYAGSELIAAVPLFRTDYRLDLSLEGPLKPAGEWLYKNAPKLVVVPVLGMGSPLTEECPIGFAPGMGAQDRVAALKALIAGMDMHAKDNKVPLLALKDITDRDAVWAHDPLSQAGFTRVATLPLATLNLPFKDQDAYLASLSSSMRSDLRKKLRRANVTIEVRDTIDGIEDEIIELFEETKANRKTDYGAFDEVPASYFREVMQAMGSRAQLMVCRVDGQLASFNIFLLERDRIIGKYVGMRYPLAREHNLYFVNWMATARLAMERGIPWLQTGHTSYQQKVRLGCQLKRSWIYFKHRAAVINPLFKLFGPMMAFDAMDPDLQALGPAAPYLKPDAAP
jgi:predicted N-acyltransferase